MQFEICGKMFKSYFQHQLCLALFKFSKLDFLKNWSLTSHYMIKAMIHAYFENVDLRGRKW